MNVIEPLVKLQRYCEAEQFRGWDPYDGLNSKLFQHIPGLKHSAICRLVMIQLFKRNPVNLRRLALIPKDYNAKGIGLLLQAYCNLHDYVARHEETAALIGTTDELKQQIIRLADLLLTLRSQGDYHGACWGYNFDWQARRLFLFPKNTPTVVATHFCATALMSAYEITANKNYLDLALSAADFVIQDLHRSDCDEGFLFSYSPLEGNDTVFNASLLGSRLLSYCYRYTGNETFKALAQESVKACCAAQRDDGAWVYGKLPVQSWVDSFHTGYNLDALIAYQELTGDTQFNESIKKGFNYYIEHFFEADGMPKYYDNKVYPIDIHCPAQLFVTLARTHQFQHYRTLAEKVLSWTVENMQDPKGYFYYQLKKGISSKIPYMRWSNAFMLYALSYYLIAQSLCEEDSQQTQ